jgi:hypothetical protein
MLSHNSFSLRLWPILHTTNTQHLKTNVKKKLIVQAHLLCDNHQPHILSVLTSLVMIIYKRKPYYFLQLGIASAFSDGDFGNIAKDVALRVSSVNHVAKIDVTLEGTVGAAASGKRCS